MKKAKTDVFLTLREFSILKLIETDDECLELD